MEKVIRDGKVAVLYSSARNRGWYSNHKKPEMLFHPKLVEVVEQGTIDNLTIGVLRELLGEEFYYYVTDIENLDIRWIPLGSTFTVEECEGREIIQLQDEYNWITA